MKKVIKPLAWCCSGIALMAGSTASAQTAPSSASEDSVDEGVIVVTAQKRGERLIDVPVPVTALDSDSLVKQNLVGLREYAKLVPGLQVSGRYLSEISIRGIGTGAGDATVAVTIDDVPTSAKSIGAIPDLDPSEVERVEVLRGPQGTLYGASSLGGLIKYVTRDPQTNRFSGRVSAGLNHVADGDFGYSMRGAVNVPIVENVLAVRLSGFHRFDAPLVDAVDPAIQGKDKDRSRFTGGRAAVYFRPFDALTINISHLEQRTRLRNGGATEITPLPTDYRPVRGYFVSNLAEQSTDTRVRLTQVRANLDLPFADLVSISAWNRTSDALDVDTTNSFGGLIFALVYPNSPADAQTRIVSRSKTNKFTQELRLESKQPGPLEWRIGGFYTDERTEVDQELTAHNADGSLIGPVARLPTTSDFEERAVFGGLTYHFTDAFNVQVGARYSENKQAFTQAQIIADPAVPIFGPSFVRAPDQSSDHSFTWNVTSQYHLDDDMMVYGRVATGYRPGGPNNAAAPEPTFGPDRVTNYEFGFKGRLLDRRLMIDTSVFRIDWTNIQLSAFSATRIGFESNGGEARSQGIEAAVRFAPGEGFVISGNAAYIDAELREDLPTPQPGGVASIGRKGDPLPFTPRFAANIAIDKSWDIGSNFQFTVGASLSRVGKRDSFFRSTDAPVARQGKLRLPAYNQLDLRAGLTDGTWDMSIYANNVFNARGLRSISDTAGQNSVVAASFILPTTIGITIGRSF